MKQTAGKAPPAKPGKTRGAPDLPPWSRFLTLHINGATAVATAVRKLVVAVLFLITVVGLLFEGSTLVLTVLRLFAGGARDVLSLR